MDNAGWLAVGGLDVVIDQVNVLRAQPKVFSTGSRGWYLSTKIDVGEERVQVSMCLTVVGSKAPAEPKPQEVNGKTRPVKGPRRPRKAPEVLNDGKPVLEVTGALPAMPMALPGQE